MDSIIEAIVCLFETDRFHAEIITGMKRVTDRKIPVAGVCIKNVIELHLNPEVFAALPLKQRVAVLKHECEHIYRDHIPRFKELAPGLMESSKDAAENMIKSMQFKSLNIAADMAINGSLPNLPEWVVFPKNFDMPPGETMEWYHQNLKNNEKAKDFMKVSIPSEPQQGDGGGGVGGGVGGVGGGGGGGESQEPGDGTPKYDDHALWAESEEEGEILKEKIRQMINKAAEATRAAGRMTGEYELIVSGLNKPQVTWQSILRRFVAKSQETKIESSKKKRNRRYGLMFPGEVKLETLHIGVAMDTSGSMSDKILEQIDAEITAMSKYATITLVQADSEIKEAYEFNPKKKRPVKGRGGTAYKPVFDYYNKEKKKPIDALIYFGDMDCFDKEEIAKPKYPVLWVINGPQNPPANFGQIIRIEE